MFCKYCGSIIDDNSKFCENCGKMVVDGSTGDFGFNGQSGTPKKNKAPLIGGIVGGVVVVAAVLGVSASAISNFALKTFASPQKYYQYVEAKAIADYVDSATNIYGNQIENVLTMDKGTINSTVNITLEENARTLLQSLSGMDMEWLANINLEQELVMAGDKQSTSVSFSLGNGSELSMDVVIDEDTIYMRVPQISEDYVQVDSRDMDDFGMYSYDSSMVEIADMSNILPDDKLLNSVGKKYMKIIMDHVDDVEKSKKTLEVEGVSQKCTALDVTLTESDIQEMLIDLIDTALVDEDIQGIIEMESILAGYDSEYAYEEFCDELEYARDEILYERFPEIKMTVYVDGKGTICGRDINIEDVFFKYAYPERGKKHGFEISAGDEYETYFELIGSGKGDDGEYSLYAYDYEVLSVVTSDFDTDALKKGNMKGKFLIVPGDALKNALGNELGYMGLPMISDMKLSLDVDSNGKTCKTDCSLMLYDETYVTMTAGYDVKGSGKVSTPSITVDLEDWAYGIDKYQIMDILSDLGIPESVISNLM